MKQLTIAEVQATKVGELGLDAGALDLTSIEALSGALRRAAGFLCPCSATTLVRGVVHPLRGLVDDLDSAMSLVENTLEALVSYGDLIEQVDVRPSHSGRPGVLLHAAPASFVARSSGAVILLGVSADHLTALPDDIASRVEYVAHVRRLSPLEDEDLVAALNEIGLVELTDDLWLKAPRVSSPTEHVSRLNRRLDAAHPSRVVPGLVLLDSDQPVHYYRGRWVDVRSQTGRFIGRREQTYGAPLWCYVEVADGNPVRLIDFPAPSCRWRGCDEAWHAQMALDAHRGTPQHFRAIVGPSGSTIVEFFSPVPMWARRRWDIVGESVPHSGCLFAYKFSDTEVREELRFCREALWLVEASGSSPMEWRSASCP